MPSPHYSDTEMEEDLVQLFKAGFPTFDEFKRNPDKYRVRNDELFESVQNSMQDQRHLLAKQKCHWRYGKENFPLEKLEAVIKSEGYSLSEVDILPIKQKQYGTATTGKDEIVVRFFPKNELRMMGVIIPNG